ncbi:MAG: CapA family protein [Clostridia bacterium]|nr:CapA family protein [Clostridia bacterium]
MIKKLLTALLLICMLALLVIAWNRAGSSYVTEAMRESFGEIIVTDAITTELPETTESPVTDVPPETAPVTTAATTSVPEEPVYPDTVLLFGGDVNLDANYGVWPAYAGAEGDLAACIDPALLTEMRGADIFMLGNLFAFTDSTQKISKRYTFRTVPENVTILSELGADIVSLANNHVYDFGAAGLTDTLFALDNQGIIHVGAGENIADAARVRYGIFNGLRIAYTAAMRSEKYINTPEATENSSGVMKMYTLDAYLDVIRQAAANSDFVVAYVHWGAENSLWLEQEQIDGARMLIDAGADIVIGSHTHTLQTVEYYNGRPIFYSVGNLWSDMQKTESALVKVTLSSDGSIREVGLIPCENEGGRTSLATPDRRAAILARLNQSSTAFISQDGIITEKK